MSTKSNSDQVQKILNELEIYARNGLISYYVNSKLDVNLANALHEIDINVDQHFTTISWNMSIRDKGKELRDLTYDSIKKSLYSMMENFAKKGNYKFNIPLSGWLVDRHLDVTGLEYFSNDGLSCLTNSEGNLITGFSWQYAVSGFALKLRKLADNGALNDLLPFIKLTLEEGAENVPISAEHAATINSRALRELEITDKIGFSNNTFYKLQ